MHLSSIFSAHFRWALIAGLGCVCAGPACTEEPEPTEASSGDERPPALPCGEETRVEASADAPEEALLEDWTVGDVLALVSPLELELEWTGWEADYFAAQQPDPLTTLVVSPVLEEATLLAIDNELDDAFCHDSIELTAMFELSTVDGVLLGVAQGSVLLRPSLEETSFYLSEPAPTFGFDTVWPASEERPEPDSTLLRLELASPWTGTEPASGTLWFHWVWLDGDERVEEFFPIASVG